MHLFAHIISRSKSIYSSDHDDVECWFHWTNKMQNILKTKYMPNKSTMTLTWIFFFFQQFSTILYSSFSIVAFSFIPFIFFRIFFEFRFLSHILKFHCQTCSFTAANSIETTLKQCLTSIRIEFSIILQCLREKNKKHWKRQQIWKRKLFFK